MSRPRVRPSTAGSVRGHGRGRVVVAADATEEEPDDLIAHELVDHAVTGKHGLGRDAIETIEEGPELGRRQTLADAVEPRMSANRRLTGIPRPAPPSSAVSMQKLQMAGLPEKRPKPTCREQRRQARRTAPCRFAVGPTGQAVEGTPQQGGRPVVAGQELLHLFLGRPLAHGHQTLSARG